MFFPNIVNSLRHQGVKELPTALRPVAYTPGGLVEAGEMPNRPLAMAVHWHPERQTDQPVTQRLFRAFVDAVGNE
jgi:putative glutamine amidotransferase